MGLDHTPSQSSTQFPHRCVSDEAAGRSRPQLGVVGAGGVGDAPLLGWGRCPPAAHHTGGARLPQTDHPQQQQVGFG